MSRPTLFHCFSARSFRPLWALEELRLPYDLKMLKFPPRVTDKSYLKINPLGTIPFFIDGETRMTESAAICEYLGAVYGKGDKADLAVRPGEADFGTYLNYLHHGEATLTFPQTIFLRYSQLETPERRNPSVAEDYAKWFIARLRMLNMRLESGEEYVAAGRFTMADISVGYALMLGESIELYKKFSPAVSSYWARLRERDGFKRAMEAQMKAAEEQGTKATLV
jgi:glutathione S-transferase